MKKKSLLKGSILVAVITLMSKVISYIVDALIAFYYGVSFYSDLYVVLITITTIVFVLVGRAISTVFIPELSSIIHTESKDKRNIFINNILNIVSSFLFIIGILGFVFKEYILLFIAPGFYENYSITEVQITVNSLGLISLSVIFIGMQSVFVGTLNSYKSFNISASISIFSNLVIMFYLIFFSGLSTESGLVIAVIISVIVQVLVLVPRLKTYEYRYFFCMDFQDKHVKSFMSRILPVILGSLFLQLGLVIDRILASTIASGSMAIINYAYKINMLIPHIIGMSIATIFYPMLAELISTNKYRDFQNKLYQSFNIALIIILPLSMFVLIMSNPIVTLMYERGNFNSNDTLKISSVLICYIPAMIVLGVKEIIDRGFYSLKDTKTPMVISIIGVLLKILFSLLLINYLGLKGLALSTSFSLIFVLIIQLFFLRKKIEFNLSGTFTNIGKSLIGSICFGFILIFIKSFIEIDYSNNFLVGILVISLLLFTSLVIYILILIVLKIEGYKFLGFKGLMSIIKK